MVYEEIGIGNEMPPIEAKPVVVISFSEVDVKNKEGTDVGKKLALKVKHPDIEEMEISGVKYTKGDKLEESGLWLGKDKDGKIPHSSAIANLLRFYGLTKISELTGEELQTVISGKGYCIVKAY